MPIRFVISAKTRAFVSVIPNAGLPLMGPNGETFIEDRLAKGWALVRDFGVDAVGGCCGTTPEHVAALRGAIDAIHETAARSSAPKVASMAAVSLQVTAAPLLVGERIAQARATYQTALTRRSLDDIVIVARGRVTAVAHVLDVCVR
jgi:5-methyltetrahydrofolate--homocysteine methyltransferase